MQPLSVNPLLGAVRIGDYMARTPGVDAAAVLQTFFGGSLTRMMTALVAESSFSEDELDALKAEIERVRKERKAR